MIGRSYFCYCCFIYNAFNEALAVKQARVFFRQLHGLVCYLVLILLFYAVAVSDYCYWRLSVLHWGEGERQREREKERKRERERERERCIRLLLCFY